MMLHPTSRGIDSRSDITPCAVVKRLFLTPEQAHIGVLVEVGGYLGKEGKSMRLYQVNIKRDELL